MLYWPLFARLAALSAAAVALIAAVLTTGYALFRLVLR